MPAELISLLDYFRQRGCLSNPQGRAAIMGEIAAGKLKAHILATPKPSGSTWQSMVRDEVRGAYGPKLVSAMSVPEARPQIEKAALALDVDWAFLKRLLVEAPAAAANEAQKLQSTDSNDRQISRAQQDRAAVILDAIKNLGLAPEALMPPKAKGSGGDRARIRAQIPIKVMSQIAFKNAWSYALKNKLVRYKCA